ncbi:MAG: hypothetical protein OXF07_03685, partial [Rhodobacter sp.]|nr:hypothetical protein [Rhodobacter sp.]
HDPMLVSLRITAWMGRLHDRRASTHVAVHHEASAGTGRYRSAWSPARLMAPPSRRSTRP